MVVLGGGVVSYERGTPVGSVSRSQIEDLNNHLVESALPQPLSMIQDLWFTVWGVKGVNARVKGGKGVICARSRIGRSAPTTAATAVNSNPQTSTPKH